MVKYSFYTLSLRKFEKEQFEEVEESNILKEYMKKKIDLKTEVSDEDLVNLINLKQREFYLKSSQFDELLGENQMKELENSLKKIPNN